MKKRLYLLIVFCFFWFIQTNCLVADNWKVGGSFREALNKKIVTSANFGLRKDLEGISRSTNVSILLDRTIDPTLKLKFPTEAMPLGQLLDQVAESIDAIALHFGSTVYIVPKAKGIRIQVLRSIQAYQLSRMPGTLESKLAKNESLSWEFLANPSDVIGVLANDLGLALTKDRQIPHDLWPAQNLPRMAKWEQLVLLFGLMDMDYAIDAKNNEIKTFKLRSEQVATSKYSRSKHQIIRSLIESRKATGDLSIDGAYTLFRSSIGNQLIVAEELLPKRNWRNKSNELSRDVFDLKTEARRGSILASIAKNRGVKMEMSEGAVPALNVKIKLDVKKVTTEELINEVLKGTELKFQLTPEKLIISK